MERTNEQIEFIDPKEAFNAAIENGTLSANNTDTNYAGLYMYMYTKKRINYFKHILTREYIHSTTDAQKK